MLLEAARAFPSVFDVPTDVPTRRPDPCPRAAPYGTSRSRADRGFGELGLPVRAGASPGAGRRITQPFPIQAATIPDALAGRDVLGRGQTGSGKTLAFGLPVLARVAASGRVGAAPAQGARAGADPRTRHAGQRRADAAGPRAAAVHQDRVRRRPVPDPDLRARARRRRARRDARAGCATSSRSGVCSLDAVEITVLDEADQMADLGFLPEVTALLDQHAGRDASGCCSRPHWTLTSTRSWPGSCTTRSRTRSTRRWPPSTRWSTTPCSSRRTTSSTCSPRSPTGRGRTIMFVQTQLAVDRLVEQLAEVGVRAGRPARRQEPAGPHPHAGRVPRGRGSTCWWRPTSPPAASTSTG